jgi:hypothetical protein
MKAVFYFAFISFLAICQNVSAQTAPALSQAETAFVQHPTHCAQFIGGKDFSDGVNGEYGISLEKALTNQRDDVKVRFARIRVACMAKGPVKGDVLAVAK